MCVRERAHHELTLTVCLYNAITFFKSAIFILVHDPVFVRVLKWPVIITPINIV